MSGKGKLHRWFQTQLVLQETRRHQAPYPPLTQPLWQSPQNPQPKLEASGNGTCQPSRDHGQCRGLFSMFVVHDDLMF